MITIIIFSDIKKTQTTLKRGKMNAALGESLDEPRGKIDQYRAVHGHHGDWPAFRY
jgi:hypothetical protein